MSDALLKLHRVSVQRGERVALDEMSLTIPLGEHTAILGPNGCGKSTLIKTITRECYPLQKAYDSHVQILGRDRWHVFDLRAMLGIVTQDLVDTYHRDHPVREVVLSGFFSSIGVWPYHHVTAPMLKKTEEILDVMEIRHLADRSMAELSSGEARRAVIGSALVHDPKALLLAEPTNSLDFRAQYEFRDIMRKLATRLTLLLVTHHLPDIVPEIGRVVLMKQGRVYADGTKADMLSSPKLSGLFDLSVDVIERNGFFYLL
jgi:iron complex transport system ATP-binding protein